MIGRGALGNPYVFGEITGKNTNVNKYDIISKHIKMLQEYYPLSFISGHIRKHLLWYLKGEQNASDMKRFVSVEPNLDKVLDALKDFFQSK